MGFSSIFLLVLVQLIVRGFCQLGEFLSIDCGGTSNHTDPTTRLAWVSDMGFIKYGSVAKVGASHENRQQYQLHRYFPADNRKYCYTLQTTERRRYLVRASFLYGNSSTDSPYPVFQLYLDCSQWSTIKIIDGSRIYMEELIIRAPSSSLQVCVCCASTGYPFISTLELRPLNVSMYATDYENDFYLKVAARVNFGALTKDPIRYPDDPYDRIWASDLDRRQNYLVGVAPGTERISTYRNIKTNMREFPPVKVMQTAVVGTLGSLSYRLNLYGFPANARAYAYLAEIEDLALNETRKFTMKQPYVPGYSNVVVDVTENANGKYMLYEPSYMNVSLDFVLSFSFSKTPDSTRGPLLNAIEISKYVQIIAGTDTRDIAALNALRSLSLKGDWRNEDGDPCIPSHWTWVNCSSSTPPRITRIALSERSLKGSIPSELRQMDQLTELWLDGNLLSGSMPDMRNLIRLTIVHLENNRLTGQIPPYLGDLPSLKELYMSNNSLSGEIPPKLLYGKVLFIYNGNPELNARRSHGKNFKLVIGMVVGGIFIFVFLLWASVLLQQNLQRKVLQGKRVEGCNSLQMISKSSTPCSISRGGSLLSDEGLNITYHISLAEIEEATGVFCKKIGEGSFGPVYYGKLKDRKEVAVKVSHDASIHGSRQFVTEVAILSRIHHRNLVSLIGYCEEGCQRILVYEYMHNGTLQDHIHDPFKEKRLEWLSRLSIAEDAARGLEYLHSGCDPTIIHRDVKSSNILLDASKKAKVSDFGLSRQADENLTHISSVAYGTVGYLDPEYYATQQLTDKSDVYSFGVVLLELITGRKPISPEDYGSEWNIVHWARSYVCEGDVASITDPSLKGAFKVESVWRLTEIAIQSVEPHGMYRPKMQEVVLAIQDAIKIEREGKSTSEMSSSSTAMRSLHPCFQSDSLTILCDDFSSKSVMPSAR